MCILCVIQKWSRRIATMLPWLVIPLIGLWALSQLLPPALRFEITSPRLACVLVLLITLFWYEVLMPQLSAWRVRRNAKLRERKRCEAIELQKLRKTATRRCRNCLTAYRDQNPGGGKFMCSYCGHISKRPVLDFRVPPGNSGILKDLVGKGGKILNGKAWSDNGWICGQDWLESGNWGDGPFSGNSSYWRSNGGGLFGGDDDNCLAERSYSRVFVFACKALAAFFLCAVWLWRKLFRISSSRDDASADSERRGMLDGQGENGVTGQESRGEKARRKAEEKRLARLEKELLEEEERKQREEVAKLVEERRRLRDAKMETQRGKGSPSAKERDSKKESERKRQERKKEKDRESCKSNSDAEDLEKRASKESDQNKKGESEGREQHRTTPETMKPYGPEIGHGFKGTATSNHNRGNAGTRCLDRMRGTFLSSSRAFTGGGFFGKNTNTSTVLKEHKPSTLVEPAQTSTYRKEIAQPDQVSGRPTVNGDDKIANSPMLIERQSCTAPKKSWQQLFTRSSAVSPSNSNVISRPMAKSKTDVQGPPFSGHPTSLHSYDNPINFGLPSQFSLPLSSFGSSFSSTALQLPSESMLPKLGDSPRQFLPEESEIFEDPCYVPDPLSLLGPVSESLDNFQLDLGFVDDAGFEKPGAVKTKVGPSEITKPSPIQSPLSRSRVSEERHANSFFSPSSPKAWVNSNNINDTGTWQMWNSCPLGQDGLGLVGGPASWNLHPEMNLPKKEDHIHPVPHKTMASLFKTDEQVISGAHPSQNVFFGNSHNGGAFNTSVPAIVDGPWLPRTLLGPTSSPENQSLLNPREGALRNGLTHGYPSGSAANHHSELSAANSWAKNDWNLQGSRDSIGNSQMSRPHIGGLYSPPDVQSLWSYD